MAKKKQTRITSKKEDYRQHVCGDCGCGEFTFEHRNLDIQGKPITLICPFNKFRKIRSETACDKWKAKKDK